MKTSSIVALGVSGLPLLIYPFILLANVMSFAGHKTGNEPAILVFVSSAFLWASTLYPIPYVFFFLRAKSESKKRNGKKETVFALAPLVCLAILGMLMIAWMVVEEQIST